jgi:hypothetical protein
MTHIQHANKNLLFKTFRLGMWLLIPSYTYKPKICFQGARWVPIASEVFLILLCDDGHFKVFFEPVSLKLFAFEKRYFNVHDIHAAVVV